MSSFIPKIDLVLDRPGLCCSLLGWFGSRLCCGDFMGSVSVYLQLDFVFHEDIPCLSVFALLPLSLFSLTYG